jgi:hypothetical protein
MLSGLFVIKGVDDKVKLFEELETESFFLDFTKVSFYLNLGILFLNLVLQGKRLWLVDVLSSK